MGSARTAPDPKFEENLRGIRDLPEDRRGMAFTTTMLTGSPSATGIMGRSTGGSSIGKSVSGVGGGSSILKSVSSLGRPSASASISGSSPAARGFTSPSEEDDVKDMRFSSLVDNIQSKARGEGMNVTKTFFSNEELQKMVKEREASRERIMNVSDRLMQKARDKKENNERLSDIASEELDQFNIKNYRAGGAEYDRDDKTSSLGGGLGMFVRGG